MKNKHIFLLFLLSCCIGFYACNNNERTFTFENQRFDTNSQLDCKENPCAEIEINVIQSIEENPVSNHFNTEIEKAVCLALNIGEYDAEETMEEAISEFNASYHEMATEFDNATAPYEATVDCQISFQNEQLISVLINSYVFTGGAHGYGNTSFLNFNPKNGLCYAMESMFSNVSDFLIYVEKVFRDKNNISSKASINSTGFSFENEQFTLPETMGFTKGEIILIYNSYEISAFSQGPVELKIPKKDVRSFFKINI